VKYLCLAYYHPDEMAALSPAQRQALVSQCPPRDAALWKTGAMVLSASLGGPGEPFSIRPRSGKAVRTDGPYTESKEVVGGFFIIEATSREEAIRIASMHPAAELGEDVGWGIEVLPIGFFQQAPPA
jgi:hypothetical protein